MQSHFSHTDPVTLFGFLFVMAFVTQWWLARRNAAAAGLQPSHVDLALPLALLVGIAGGTLLALLPPQDQQLAGPDLAVDIRLRLFGIVLSGTVALFAYSRFAGLSFRRLLDVVALPTLAAIAVHRLGCFYAGCCWGDLSIAGPDLEGLDVASQLQTLPWLAGDWVSWAVAYGPGTWPYEQQLAVGLIGPDADRSLPVHPVQLYEAVLLAAQYLWLRRLVPDAWPPGGLAVAASLSYLLIRFPLEFLRADGAIVLAGLTLVQLQSIALAVVVISAGRFMLPGPRYAR